MVREKLYWVAQTLHKDCGGRLMRRENLHLTLVFLGDVVRKEIPQLELLARRLRCARFNLNFGITGYWRHNRILWAAPTVTPEPLRELVVTLENGLKTAGIKFDQRRYVPHVTLARDARAPAALPPLAFDWQVGEFALIESARGYRALASWALGP